MSSPPTGRPQGETPDMDGSDTLFVPADDEHVRREKAKARKLRESQWWKNLRGQGKCHYCGGRFPPAELTMDHTVPIIRGGSSTRRNVVPCCKECNSQKRYLVPAEWEQHLARLREESARRR